MKFLKQKKIRIPFIQLLLCTNLFLFSTKELSAANFFSIASGTWTETPTIARWSSTAAGGDCSCAPDFTSNSGDDITIRHNIDATGTFNFSTGGTLTITSGNTLTLNGDVEFDNGRIVLIESGAYLIVNGNLNNKNNSNQVTVDGEIIVNGAFTGANGSTIVGAGSLQAESINLTGGSVFGNTNNCNPTPPETGCISSVSGGTVPLPIELYSFSIKSIENQIHLNWTTASELNNDYFTIYRSTDGNQYTRLAQLDGAGTSKELIDYHFIDVAPVAGRSYYKLRQTDYDGQFEEFGPYAIRFVPDNVKVFVYQLPETGQLQLKTYGMEAGKKVVASAFNANGVLLYTTSVSIDKDPATEYLLEPISTPGLAIFHVYYLDGFEVQKLIVK